MTEHRTRVWLAGAGVSANSPTNFPVAWAIVHGIVSAIAPDDATRGELLVLSDPTRPGREHAADYLRFESLIETIQSIADEELHVLDLVERFRTPNLLHACLAAAAMRGDTVLTPNFDGCIEQSLLDAGATPHTIATDEAFRDARSGIDGVPVFKLHGSYEQYDGGTRTRSAATMQATVESITAGMRALQLSEPKRELLASVADGELIVIGYSGSDDFDIVPTLTATGFARCTWIVHEDSPAPRDITDDVLAGILARRPHEWLERERFFHAQAGRGAGRLRILAAHTPRWLAAEFGCTWDPPSGPRDDLRDYWAEWARRYVSSGATRELICGQLFDNLSRYTRALSLFTAAAAADTPDRGLAEVQRSRMLIRRGAPGDFAEAEEAARKAVALAAPDDVFASARALHQLAYVLYRRGRFGEAVQWYDRVLGLPAQRDTRDYVMRSTHDKGVVLQDLGRHDEAAPLLERAYELSWELGDYRHVAWSLHHIGLGHFHAGRLEDARRAHEESRAHAARAGDLNHLSLADHELGMLDFLAGDVAGSIARIEGALAMSDVTGSTEFRGVDLQHLGVGHLELGERDRARELFEQAALAYAEVEDRENLAELYCYVAQLELECADRAAALEAVVRAETLEPQTPEYGLRIRFMRALAEERCSGALSVVEEAERSGMPYALLDLVYFTARFGCADPVREPFRMIAARIADEYARFGNARRAAAIRSAL